MVLCGERLVRLGIFLTYHHPKTPVKKCWQIVVDLIEKSYEGKLSDVRKLAQNSTNLYFKIRFQL